MHLILIKLVHRSSYRISCLYLYLLINIVITGYIAHYVVFFQTIGISQDNKYKNLAVVDLVRREIVGGASQLSKHA